MRPLGIAFIGPTCHSSGTSTGATQVPPTPDPGPLVQTQEVRTSTSLYWCISRPWAAPGLLERAHRKQEGQKTQEGSSEVAGGQVVGSLPTDAFLGSVSGGRRDLSSIMKA